MEKTRLRVLLPTLGSAGDVHPVIAVGLAMQARGHRATIITNPYFQPLIEQHGLGFLAVGTLEEAEQAFLYPHLFELRRGAEHILRLMLAPIEQVYRLIERHADRDTVVATSGLTLGARVAQDKLGIPTASMHLQPSLIRSCVDQGLAGKVRIAAWQPRWAKQALYALLDALMLDRIVKPELNRLRATLGLEPVTQVFGRWLQSPQLVIGLFPDWFASPQPDWPPHTHLVGFPLWDRGDGGLPPDAEQFLIEGPAPVIFTPGSAGSTMHRYFRESVQAVSSLGLRAMLVTNSPRQLPKILPPGVRSFGYLPFSALLRRAAIMVHHGGIGTIAQTINAGVPQLIAPHAHDQFDNAWRIDRLGLGRRLSVGRYRAGRVARIIKSMLADHALQSRCAQFANRIQSDTALVRTCELLERLHAGAVND